MGLLFSTLKDQKKISLKMNYFWTLTINTEHQIFQGIEPN